MSNLNPERKERFSFFFRAQSPFSQFHTTIFKAVSLFSSPQEEEVTFNHCEQWMMFNKAKLFKDEETADKIIKAKDPQKCKALGRQVKNFDQVEWNKHNRRIIYEGNKLKFTQNEELFKELEKTKGTTLVEASLYDRIYGIGLNEKDPRALNRNTWLGQNLLGETLTTLREEICP